MAKKKSVASNIDITPKVGDSVKVITPTIFDSKGKLSDLLATGVVTKVSPEPGWDYEVTFNGSLSLDGRDEIKVRFYNAHQIVKVGKHPEVLGEIRCGIYGAIIDAAKATDQYNYVVRQIMEIDKRIARSTTDVLKLAELYQERERLFSAGLHESIENLDHAKSVLASEIRALLAEYPAC